MKWSEVRALHPNKFVLLEKLKEHIDGNYKYAYIKRTFKKIHRNHFAKIEMYAEKIRQYIKENNNYKFVNN